MKSFLISKNDAEQRLDKFILKKFPKLPKSLMFKEIRKKNIKINKNRTQPDYILAEGDLLELYLKDDALQEKEVHYDFMSASKELDIVFEDKNILLANKKAGLLCHPDGKVYTDTLIARIKRYLFEKGEWNPTESETFTPALANRIDRNTSGIVIAAKNAQSLRELNRLLKTREIEKYYLTIVHSVPEKAEDTLCAYLIKDEKKNKVSVFDYEKEGSKKIETHYRVVDYCNACSLLEIELKTGRTHQIRAQMAHIGHPLLNDGKYGKEQGRFRQELCSYKLVFNLKSEGPLEYLNGRTFELKDCEIIKKYKEIKENEK